MIESILKQHVTFEGAANLEKFQAIFTSIYNIALFKDGLDLVLTKMQEGDLKFEVKIIKGWDTNVGCYLTEQNKTYNKILNTFSDKFRHKIIIKNLLVNVVAHEMAHALEIESGLVLNEEFRKCIGLDMKDRKPGNLALNAAIKQLMVDEVKRYPEHQVISELFARYFELLSISRDVEIKGNFLTKDVMDFFVNTTRWIEHFFNPKIKPKIDLSIANHTARLIHNNAFKVEQKFAHKVDSFFKQVNEQGQKSWGANVKSNAMWYNNWQKHQGSIEKNPTNQIENKTDN